jgi:diguanylate cyclase (GGDEF)-like protein/PAS domain S-box-containing protein
VRAVAVARHAEHLLGVVRAEFGNLEARRGLRRIEAQLRETERRCDALIASSRDPIAYIHEGMHIRANDAYLEMFGFESFEDVEGLSLLDLIAPQQVGEFKQLLKSMSKGDPRRRITKPRRAARTGKPSRRRWNSPPPGKANPAIQVVFRRREEVDPELARELEALRQRDAVTGLLNRPTFLHALEDAVARVGRGEALYGLLLLEPDHYARLLPDIGIDSADALVAALAVHLQASLGDEATIARVGDHGFGVLLEGTYPQTVTTAERLRDAFGHVFAIGERSIAVTASIGGVQIGEKIASVGPVLAKAAESLRTALDLGGGAIHVYDPSAVDRAEEERIQLWVKRIAESLQGDGFVLHYLPVLNLLGAPGELYETVLRMQVNDELAMPSAFLGIAEDHDLLGAIDHWVVRRAIATLGERLRAGHDTRLLVKVSPASFGSPLLAGLIERELAKHGVPASGYGWKRPRPRSSPTCNAQDFLAAAGRLGASGWSSSARGWIRSSCCRTSAAAS